MPSHVRGRVHVSQLVQDVRGVEASVFCQLAGDDLQGTGKGRHDQLLLARDGAAVPEGTNGKGGGRRAEGRTQKRKGHQGGLPRGKAQAGGETEKGYTCVTVQRWKAQECGGGGGWEGGGKQDRRMETTLG